MCVKHILTICFLQIIVVNTIFKYLCHYTICIIAEQNLDGK